MKKIYLVLVATLFLSSQTSAALFSVTAVALPPTCGLNNGSITVTAAGGIAPFLYSINGGPVQTSNTFSGLGPGTHTVVVTDAIGDTGSVTLNMASSPAVFATASTAPASCSGNDGSITVTASGGTAPYLFSFDGGVTFQPANIFTNLSPGVYLVSVMDINGCMSTVSATIALINTLTVNAGPDTAICAGGSLQLNGSAASTYSWSPSIGLSDPSIANPIATPLTTTSYTLTVTSGSCTASDNVIISVLPAAAAFAGNDTAICTGGSTQLSGSGGGFYSWSPAVGLNDPAISNPTATPAITTAYVLTVINASGCSGYDTVLVSVQTSTSPVITANNSVLTVANPGAAVTYTWQIINNGVWEDVIPAATGITYAVTLPADYRVKAVDGICISYSNSLTAGRAPSSNAFEIDIYPNPTTAFLVLDGLKTSDSWEILEIVNAQGARVMTQNIKNLEGLSMNVSAFQTGVYNLQLKSTNGKTAAFRFVKI